MEQNILIVEDESGIADTIRYALESEGFSCIWVSTGMDAMRSLQADPCDLIILDIGLPDCNGLELCKDIRQKWSTPVVFLTARSHEIDRIVGLEIGGDDYIVKPFSPRELSARVRAILRRCSPSQSSTSNTIFQLDEERCRIAFHGKSLDLSRTEYRLLAELIKHPGRVFSREQLMNRAWDVPESSLERTVDAHIKSLRAKLKRVDEAWDPIQTHRGMGYSLKETP